MLNDGINMIKELQNELVDEIEKKLSNLGMTHSFLASSLNLDLDEFYYLYANKNIGFLDYVLTFINSYNTKNDR